MGAFVSLMLTLDTANARLATLQAEREKLAAAAAVTGEAPQIDAEVAMGYRRDIEKAFATGSPAEKKQILRTWVAEMKLAPEALEVTWTYRLPEPVVNPLVAGAGFVAEEKTHIRRWIVETAFQVPKRAVETVSRGRRMDDQRPEWPPKGREVAGW